MLKNYFTLLNKDVTSIAIGGFDGMHYAHKILFDELDSNGAIVCIETGYANLTPKEYRKKYTKFPIYFYNLNDVKGLEGGEFIKLLQTNFPNLEKIVVGFDFHFGKNRKYSTNELKTLFKGKIQIVQEIKIDNIAVHSRKIRELLQNDNLELANKFLGRFYEIEGQIIKGQGLGTKSFVPTINLDVNNFLLPKAGVYITKTVLDEKTYKSISFIGHRITTDGNFAVETHILENFTEYDLKNVQIEFLQKIRNNIKFDSFEKLKNQIIHDINSSKKFFSII